MLVKAKKVTVTAGSFANDMYKRRALDEEAWLGMKRSPKVAQKIDMYTILSTFQKGWTEFARPVSTYESEDEYLLDIGPQYEAKKLMRGGKRALV